MKAGNNMAGSLPASVGEGHEEHRRLHPAEASGARRVQEAARFLQSPGSKAGRSGQQS